MEERRRDIPQKRDSLPTSSELIEFLKRLGIPQSQWEFILSFCDECTKDFGGEEKIERMKICIRTFIKGVMRISKHRK